MSGEPACPACGARWEDGQDCQSQFEALLALEFADPAYGQVHFFTVACYMIQHGRYSPQAQAWVQQKLRAVLQEGLKIDQLRTQAAAEHRPCARTAAVLRSADEPPAPRVKWRVTLADVAAQAGSAESYCAAVRRWAEATLEQMPGAERRAD